MATKAEIQAQIEELTKSLDSADDGDEVELWVKDEKGRETKLTGAYAKKWLKALGLEDDEPPADGQDPDGGDGKTPEDPPPAGGSTVWGRKGK